MGHKPKKNKETWVPMETRVQLLQGSLFQIVFSMFFSFDRMTNRTNNQDLMGFLLLNLEKERPRGIHRFFVGEPPPILEIRTITLSWYTSNLNIF